MRCGGPEADLNREPVSGDRIDYSEHFGHLMAMLCHNENNSEVDKEILHVLSILLELYN